VFIETFAGKRNYYTYTVPKIDLDQILAHITDRFPQHKISGLTRSDPGWTFFKNYSDKYLRD
jgi:hypothetical protein